MLVCNNYNRQAWVGLAIKDLYSYPSVMIFEEKGPNITSAKRMLSKVSVKLREGLLTALLLRLHVPDAE